MTSSVHPQHHDDEPLLTEDAQGPVGFHTSTQIGKLFTLARRELNVSLHSVAQKIHVRATYLEAIERGDLDKLPSPLYAAGFIRLYARYVQLDGDEILRRLDLAKEHTLSHGALLHSTPHVAPNRFALVLSGILTFLSLSLVGFLIWYSPLPVLSEGFEHLQSALSSKPFLDTEEIQKTKNQTISAVEQEQKDEPVAPHSTDKIEKPKRDLFEESKEIQKENKEAIVDDHTVLKSSPNTTGLKENVVRDAEKSFTFFAHDDCWLDIRRDDHVLFSAVLKMGKTYTLDSIKDIEISVGNAPALEMKYGEITLEPLSRMDRVVKHVRLDAYTQQYDNKVHNKQ